jgi:hypothetical protein
MRKYRCDPPADARRRYDELSSKSAHSLTVEERKFITDYWDCYGYFRLEKNCKDCYWEDWRAYEALHQNPQLDPYYDPSKPRSSIKCNLYGWLPEEKKGCWKFLFSNDNL